MSESGRLYAIGVPVYSTFLFLHLSQLAERCQSYLAIDYSGILTMSERHALPSPHLVEGSSWRVIQLKATASLMAQPCGEAEGS